MTPLVAAVSSDAALVLVELGIAVLIMAGSARLASRFGLSPIPLYLLVGIAIGSGWLPVDPEPSFVETGSLIGVVLLLLTLGLEYSPSELVSNLRRGFLDGLVDFAANFTPGLLAGLLFGWSPLAAVLLGGVTWVSSSGVVAKTLADLGRLGFRETPTVLSIIVLEDLGMAVYLPIVAALLAGGAFLDGFLLVVGALAVVGVVLVIAVRRAEAVSRIVATPSGEGFLLTILGATLLVAGLAELAQVSAAVGAFLIGTAITGQIAERARDAIDPLRDLFAAIFFLFFGIQIDISSVGEAAGAATLLALVTIVTKYWSARWSAARAGIGKRGRVRAATVLIARGEFSIVIASLGATLEPRLSALAGTYVLITVLAGPLITRLAVRDAPVRIGTERDGDPLPAEPATRAA
ncbi:MAG: cation:proton antiporter [Acidimicrobiia bacterium]|nr:cation:proton antiporter [Acidimicrobiia bacterium]